MVQAGGLALLVLSCLLLFNVYRRFVRERKKVEVTPQQVHLPFWANLSITLVVALILWLIAPWAGYLTVGRVPQFFMDVPWQHLALANVAVLLIGFWKLEDCNWIYDPAEKIKKKHLTRVWTPKDTLWLSVILFLIALAFSYTSSDVLSSSIKDEKARGSGHFNIDDVNMKALGGGFRLPDQ